jgi:phosphohistidine phosphatase SixA
MRSRPGTIQRSATASARSHLGGARLRKRVARWTKKHAVNPQLVVCSSAVRAQQTLQRMLPSLGEPAVWVEVTLYAAGAEHCSPASRPFRRG